MDERKLTSRADSADERPLLTVRVFGGIGIEINGEPLSIGGPRQQRLLALLAIRAGAICDIDWLAEYLWSDDDRPAETEPSIRVSVSRLRRVLVEADGDSIATAPGGYRLNTPRRALEHLRFSDLRDAATAARERDDPLAAQGFLGDALALWRGAPFIELQDLDWARAEIERLHQDRLEMTEEHFEVELALGRHTQITGGLAAFTAENSLRERSWRQYALALHRSGRPADAVNALQEYRRQLSEQSGLDPSAEVLDLEAKLLASDPSLQPDPVGRPLRGYRLVEQIGSGAFSVVWRGVQPSVNRDVAVKQIRSELASQPEFIRRFEAEAQLVARIEHPYIVPLIDYWRDPDSAYLVMRWLRGGTLERSLDDAAWSVERTLNMAEQIGGALAEAHAAGVVHRDVKTANILLDESGNAFLGDFGIALDAVESAGPAAALSNGSPAYASPEQLRRQQLGPQADIFSLGIVLYECLTGSLPFPDATTAAEMVQLQLSAPFPPITRVRPDVPASVAAAIERATAKDPAQRFETVQEFVTALLADSSTPRAASTSNTRHTALQGEILNPYKGLRSFDQGDADEFFGRDRLVAELLVQLEGNDTASRCVTIVGPSGSGKSSVVRAGLIPALRAGRIPGADQWYITTMTPGTNPFEALEAALLRVAVNPPPALLEQLLDGPRGILRSVRRCLADDADRVVLVIDQFEELFLGCEPETIDAFLKGLAAAIDDPTTPLRVVATVRADFYDRPLSHPTFAPILKSGAVDVTPLAADELEEAIVGPASRSGVNFEPGLVARLAAQTLGQPAPLPLLQYALSELFDRLDGTTMTASAYDEIGGLSGALAARAEAIYLESDEREQAAARRVFGRLTDPEATRRDLRSRVLVADLGADDATASVLERFGHARLLSFDRDVASREPTVEVAHEALLREWPRLVTWLDEDRDVLRSVHQLATSSQSWDSGGRQASDLYRGGRLDLATDLAANAPDRLSEVDHDFVTAARDAAQAEQEVEQQRTTRLRRLVVGLAAAALVAFAAAGFAYREQSRANDEAERAAAAAVKAEAATEEAEAAADEAQAANDAAELATLISRSAAISSDDPSVSVLLALEANRRRPSPESNQAVLIAMGSLGNRVATIPPVVPDGTSCDIDGEVALDGWTQYSMIDGALVLYEIATGELVEIGSFPGRCGYWAADLAKERIVAFASDGATAWFGPYGSDVWDVELSFELRTFSAALSPGGPPRVLLRTGSAWAGGTFWLVDTESGDPVGEPLTDLVKPTARFSSDGRLVAIGSGTTESPDGAGPVVVLDAETGDPLFTTELSGRAQAFHFDLERGELIAGTSSGRVVTIDLGSGRELFDVASSTAAITWLGVRPDGVVVSGSRGLVEEIDRETGPTAGQGTEVRNVAVGVLRSDGTILLHQDDHTNEVLDPDGSPLAERSIRTDGLTRAEFGFGRAVLLNMATGEADVVDLETQERTAVDLANPDGTGSVPIAVLPQPDGFITFGNDLTVTRFSDGEMTDQLEAATEDGVAIRAGEGFAGRVALLGDRRLDTQEAHLIATDTDRLTPLLTVAVREAVAVYPSPDDGLHVLLFGGDLVTYNADGEVESTLPTGLCCAGWAAGNGQGRLAFGGGAGAVVADLTTGKVDRIDGVGVVASLGFVRNGELLVIGSRDGTVRLWDVENATFAGEIWDGDGTGLGRPWYDEMNDSVWVSTAGSAVRLPLAPERWIDRACEVVGRDLSEDEWSEHVPGDEPWQPTCSGR